MVKASKIPPPGFEDLSVEDQIGYVQSLWDIIAAAPDKIPVPQWHREVLDERLKDYEKDPTEGLPWEDLREDLLGQNKSEDQ